VKYASVASVSWPPPKQTDRQWRPVSLSLLNRQPPIPAAGIIENSTGVVIGLARSPFDRAPPAPDTACHSVVTNDAPSGPLLHHLSTGAIYEGAKKVATSCLASDSRVPPGTSDEQRSQILRRMPARSSGVRSTSRSRPFEGKLQADEIVRNSVAQAGGEGGKTRTNLQELETSLTCSVR
jgi:hypothetical protein